MIVNAIGKTISGLLNPKSTAVVLKSLGLTLILFFGVWLALNELVSAYVVPWMAGWTWISTTLIWLTGIGVVFGAGFLLAPVVAIFAGLFLDDIADHVERKYYPEYEVGSATPLGPSILLALKFGIVVIFANVLAFLLVFVAGFGVIVFFLVNGYLLGREYFLFACMRFHSEKEAHRIRKKWSLEVFLAGLAIAFVMSIPIVNLLTPVFAATLMVHINKELEIKSLQPE